MVNGNANDPRRKHHATRTTVTTIEGGAQPRPYADHRYVWRVEVEEASPHGKDEATRGLFVKLTGARLAEKAIEAVFRGHEIYARRAVTEQLNALSREAWVPRDEWRYPKLLPEPRDMHSSKVLDEYREIEPGLAEIVATSPYYD
jgi:hypothetical protein